MFDINDIQIHPITQQCTCSCDVGSSSTAKEIHADYLMFVRNKTNFTAEIKIEEDTVTIASNSPNTTKWIANYINKNFFMPPLDVYVFYCSRQKDIENRWCVGFDFPDSTRLIDFLNKQGQMVIAYSDPQNWHDKNGKSYSVIMHTGVMEPELTEDVLKLLNQKTAICLNAIHNTTFRKLNLITIQ